MTDHDGPSLAELLDDPEWERRQLRKSLDHLRRAVDQPLAGGPKVIAWHVNFLRAEVLRIPVDYPNAVLECPAEVDDLLETAERRARELAG